MSTAAPPPIRRRPTPRPGPPRRPRDLLRAAARDAARVARPDDRVHGAADDRRRPRRARPALLGRHRVPARRHRDDPAVGADERPLRPQAPVPGRDRRVPHRLRAERRRAVARRADRVPRAAGPRRRRADDARDGDRRRHRLPARARAATRATSRWSSCSRASPGRCSAACSPTTCRGAGSSTSTCRSAPRADRRLDHVALHLPVERRPRIDWLGAALLAGAMTCLCSSRLGRARVRVGLGRDRRPRRRRGRAARRVRRAGAPGAGADPAAAAVPRRRCSTSSRPRCS